MDSKTRKALIGRGLPTDLIEKISSFGHTVTNLKGFSGKTLRKSYTEEETELIQQCIKRNPIPEEVVDELLFLSNGVCCYCRDGNSTRPYQIHHIVEHSITQDDSLENLMVACPTHHAAIPLRGYSVEEQKAQRALWYAIADVERDYRKRGIPFPYQSFEPITYSTETSISEIFLFGPVSPSTARELSQHSLGTTASDKLQRDNFLIIAGDSGSGKSTLAIGVAGMVPGNGENVYRYIRSSSLDSRVAVQEILTFANTSARACVLVIDDINLWGTRADIEKIAVAASAMVKVIATATNEHGRSEEPAPDRPFPFNRMHISWDIVRPFVTAYLRTHEPEVVAALQKRRNESHSDRLGLSAQDHQLDHLIQRYEQQAKSIWQFLFLLSAGWITIDNDLAELVAAGRSDVPALYAALEQIADAERAVGATEAAKAITGLDYGAPLPPPDANWVTSVYERLVVNRRVMQRIRNNYTTVHRDWARAFICAAIGNAQSRDTTIQLLLRDLNLTVPQPRRFATLLSWLRYSKHCGEFIKDWAKNQKPEDWSNLVKAATDEGLAVTGEVASQLHVLFHGEDWKEILGDAFEVHEAKLCELVSRTSPEDWHNLQNLFMTISNARPDLGARIVESWDPASAANVLNHTHPDYYDSVYWFLGGSVCKHSRQWCHQVGKHIDWPTIKQNLLQIRKGDVQAVDDCLSVLKRLGVPIMRSMARDIGDIVRDILMDAPLSDIRCGDMIVEIEVFPEEMSKVVGALDAKRLAEEVSRTPPHKWIELMHLVWIGARAGSSFPQDVVEHLIDDELVATVHKYAEAHPRIFVPLLWQLAYGRPERRREITTKLFESAIIACRQNDGTRDEILRAFAKVDSAVAENLAQKFGVTLPAADPEDEEAEILNRPILETAGGGSEAAEELRILEQSGEDYDVGLIIDGPYEADPKS